MKLLRTNTTLNNVDAKLMLAVGWTQTAAEGMMHLQKCYFPGAVVTMHLRPIAYHVNQVDPCDNAYTVMTRILLSEAHSNTATATE